MITFHLPVRPNLASRTLWLAWIRIHFAAIILSYYLGGFSLIEGRPGTNSVTEVAGLLMLQDRLTWLLIQAFPSSPSGS